MRILILTIFSIFVFYGCHTLSSDGNGESSGVSVQSRCFTYYGSYRNDLKKCNLYNEEEFILDNFECYLYDDVVRYEPEEYYLDGKSCGKYLEVLTCEELGNMTKIDDVEACATFRDKEPVKTKKQICAENYFMFCEKQYHGCESISTECETAKYTTSGEDPYITFKMSKLLELCEFEGSDDATVNDLDCILEENRHDFDCNANFEDFRASCTKYFD